MTDELSWRIPPSEAAADHGEYAVESCFDTVRCMYKPNGGEWRRIGSAHFFSTVHQRGTAIDDARRDGDRHHVDIKKHESTDAE